MSRPTTAPAVVVIGNGPVGQTAALLLARWGVPNVVVDAAPSRRLLGSKAICQQRDVLDVWETVGIGAQVAEEGITWETARTFHRDAELFCVQFRDRGDPTFPPWVNISQSRVEQLLDARLDAQPLADVRWGHEVVDVTQDDRGVTVRCATADGQVDLWAPYAIVCAGAGGDDLREALGVSYDGTSFDDRFLICDIRADLPGWSHERRFYFDPEWNPGRQVLIHPCPDSTFRIDWQVPPDFDLDHEIASGGLDRRIRRIVGDRAYEIVWRSVYRFHSRRVDRMRVGRVLLAGDIAHVMAPFGARGLNSGVQDAENAAWKLAFVLRGWAPEDLLETYHDERIAAAVENLDVTSATMRFLVPQDEQAHAERVTTLARAATDESARARVNSGRLAEPYWYVDSALTTPDPTRPVPTRPPVGAQPTPAPGVIVPDVQLRDGPGPARLRALARDGILVIVTDGTTSGGLTALLGQRVAAPVRVVELAALDPGGAAARALGARPGEAWVIRPDAHVAAIVDAGDTAALEDAVRRACGATDRPARTSPTTRSRR